MSKELYEKLLRIYNNLCNINTKGEDTMIMGACLQSFMLLLKEYNEKEE